MPAWKFLLVCIFCTLPSIAFAQETDSLMSSVPVQVIGWVLAVFGFLKAVSTFLNFIADKTKTDKDNKAALFFGKVLGYLGKVIDLFTANTRPK